MRKSPWTIAVSSPVGQVLRQPLDEAVHRGNPRGAACLVLLRPARDLPRDVTAHAAVVAEADGAVIDAVQRRDHAVELVVVRAAFGARHAGKRRVPQHAALDVLHEIERRPDHAVVLAERDHPRDGNVGRGERLHHAIFAIDGVRRGQQRAGRLAAQHIVPSARGHAIRGIGLPALVLEDGEVGGVGESDLVQVSRERRDVEGMQRRDEPR